MHKIIDIKGLSFNGERYVLCDECGILAPFELTYNAFVKYDDDIDAYTNITICQRCHKYILEQLNVNES